MALGAAGAGGMNRVRETELQLAAQLGGVEQGGAIHRPNLEVFPWLKEFLIRGDDSGVTDF